jgi:hypothetical protein
MQVADIGGKNTQSQARPVRPATQEAEVRRTVA